MTPLSAEKGEEGEQEDAVSLPKVMVNTAGSDPRRPTLQVLAQITPDKQEEAKAPQED